MKKTDKKIDNAIRTALTEVCSFALEEFEGFKWLTHCVDYRFFPQSLSVTCVFDKNLDLLAFIESDSVKRMRKLIKDKLAAVQVSIRDTHKNIRFDTEENCDIENDGKWHERLSVSSANSLGKWHAK